MTFQPPPPPPPQGPPPQGPPPPPGGQPPGGQPPGQWGPPPGQPYRAPGSGFDPKSVNQLDWGILGAGALAFIFSFVSYYTFSDAGYSVSESAWHGFFGWFAMLLALIGSAAVALELFSPQTKLPFPNRLIGLGAYALSTLCVILALFVTPSYLGVDVPDSVDEGHGFGYWISIIVIIAGLVLSFLRFQQSGGQLPGRPQAGGHQGGGQPGGGQPGGGQPGGGYGPPQGPPR